MSSTPGGSTGPRGAGPNDTQLDGDLAPEVATAETMAPMTGPTMETSDLGGSVVGREVGQTSRDIPNGTMVGDYRVEGKLGEGGMGAVYAAVHPMIGKQAAIKVIKPDVSQNAEAVERFVQEARAVNQIGHPNIVDVFAFGALPDGRSFFAMEWLKGESLRERIARGRLATDEIVHILDRVIRGLEAAHDKKIIHRDLKPDNVFLVDVKGERPLVKLLDFGLAKLTGNADTRMERTRTGAMMGTPMYIAPEQARGYQVDHRADIYSLGVMAFEMFTGVLPFEADNAMDLIAQHLSSPAPAPSTKDPGLLRDVDELLLAMLEKEPARRPSLIRVREVLEKVRTLPAQAPAAMTIPDTMLPAAGVEVRRETRRGRLALVAAVVVLLCGAGVVAMVAMGGEQGGAEKKESGTGTGTGTGTGSETAIGGPVREAAIGSAAIRSAVIETVDAGVVPDEPVAATLVVEVSGASEAVIMVDGAVVTRSGKRASVEVTRGKHEIAVTARGRKPVKRSVDLSGGNQTIEIAMERVKAGAGVGSDSGSGKGSGTGSGSGSAKPDDDALVDPFRKKRTP